MQQILGGGREDQRHTLSVYTRLLRKEYDMKLSDLLSLVILWIVAPYLLLFGGLIVLAPIAIPLLIWFWYEKRRDKKRLEMVIAENAIRPGSYCAECLCLWAGNPVEHPHTYSCSHSKELHIPKTKRSSL